MTGRVGVSVTVSGLSRLFGGDLAGVDDAGQVTAEEAREARDRDGHADATGHGPCSSPAPAPAG